MSGVVHLLPCMHRKKISFLTINGIQKYVGRDGPAGEAARSVNVTGIMGNIVLENSGLHKRKTFSENYRLFGPQNFPPALYQAEKKNYKMSVFGDAHMYGAAPAHRIFK